MGKNELPQGFTLVELPEAPLQNEGDSVQGEYLGEGKYMEFEGKQVPTYRVRTDDGIVSILGSAQIARFFEGVDSGVQVYIERVGSQKARKGKMNTYRFAVGS